MPKVGIFLHDALLDHSFGPSHPFKSRERIVRYLELLRSTGMLESKSIDIIRPAGRYTEDFLLLVHEPSLINIIKSLSEKGGLLDSDTPVPRGTYDRTLIQLSCYIDACKYVALGRCDRAVVCTAFGGHHATREHTGFSFGFCYFNFDAVAAKVLQGEGLARSLAIIDLDAHHGNAIQEAFYEDPSVLYISLHQDGRTLYPGTGFQWEIGSGRGEGYNVNVPLPPGVTDGEYLDAISEVVVPLIRCFRPDAILALMGADVHFSDPLTGLKLTIRGIGESASMLVKIADEVCEGKLIVAQGGGYDVEATARAFCLVTSALAGLEVEVEDVGPAPRPNPRIKMMVRDIISDVRRRLAEYWPTAF